MSSALRQKDAASLPQDDSPEEDPKHQIGNSDCGVCRNLRSSGPEYINTTYAKLQRAAADGCELCKILQQVSEAICTSAGTIIWSTNAVYVQKRLWEVEECAAYMCVELLREGVRYTGNALFYAVSGDSCPWRFMTSNLIPDENASIWDCAQSIIRMLGTCNASHTTCKASNLQRISSGLVTPQFIPKRLLHISGDCEPLQVRLYETTSSKAFLEGVSVRYTALSHCWGSTPVIKTTTDTVSGFKTAGINWLLMPKTFQEAMMLTRALGINYIWIDSLCILQDSVSDWVHEASQMASIFSNSYLTIAAAAAENGHQGLLNRRRTTQKFDAVHSGGVPAVFVRKTIQHEFEDSGGYAFLHATDLPLRKRAWCFQEELLSIRIIHFTQDEVAFVCREATTCECDPRWRPRFMLPPIVGTSSVESFQIWENTVEHYTGRQISFHKDRLPALSSFTHYFQEDSDCYHAGLWESHMPGSLLWWSQCGKRPKRQRSSQSSPPSWSWASIKGVVEHSWMNELQRTVAQVLDVCTYPSTIDPRGMVSGGQITLRAPLFPLGGIWKSYEKPSWQSYLRYFNGGIDSCFCCSPGWAPNHQWLEQDHCYFVLDDLTNPLVLLPDGVIDTPIFLFIVRTLNESVLHEGVLYSERCAFLGLLLKPLGDLDQIQKNIMKDSESKLPFVRIGFGGMRLSEEDREEALQRFGNTTVTIF